MLKINDVNDLFKDLVGKTVSHATWEVTRSTRAPGRGCMTLYFLGGAVLTMTTPDMVDVEVIESPLMFAPLALNNNRVHALQLIQEGDSVALSLNDEYLVAIKNPTEYVAHYGVSCLDTNPPIKFTGEV